MATPSTRHFPRAIAMLVGTIIGVGIFGVPYLVAQSGVRIGLIHFAVLTAVILLVHLFFGEIALRTKKHERLVGYASQYLGPTGKRLAAISAIGGIYGAIIAYITVSGQFLHELLGSLAGGTPWQFSVGFAVIGAIAIAIGMKLVEDLEFVLTAFLFVAMALIFVVGGQRIDAENLRTIDWSSGFLPYGAILFSLGGVSVIAEIRDTLRGRERLLPRAIAWGTLLAALVSALFVVVVVGVSGAATSPESIAGLAPILGRSIVTLGSVLGFLAIATSFLTLGLYLCEVFELDFHLPKRAAFVGAIVVPFLIFLIGNPSFTQIILITGAVFGGIDGVLIAIIVLKARTHGDRKPEYTVRVPSWVNGVVVLVFLVGIAVTIRDLLVSHGFLS